MRVWTVILGAVVALVLLQLVVYRYLWATEGSVVDREPPNRAPAGGENGRPREGHEPFDVSTASWVAVGELPDGTRRRHCPHCGAENEPEAAYTFCWDCAARLR